MSANRYRIDFDEQSGVRCIGTLHRPAEALVYHWMPVGAFGDGLDEVYIVKFFLNIWS